MYICSIHGDANKTRFSLSTRAIKVLYYKTANLERSLCSFKSFWL